jgi:hypothetical protein
VVDKNPFWREAALSAAPVVVLRVGIALSAEEEIRHNTNGRQ